MALRRKPRLPFVELYQNVDNVRNGTGTASREAFFLLNTQIQHLQL
jgi:hypothetical protein